MKNLTDFRKTVETGMDPRPKWPPFCIVNIFSPSRNVPLPLAP